MDFISKISDVSQSIPSRCASVQILGKISFQVPKEEFKRDLLPKVSHLCRDFNWEVRKTLSEILGSLFDLLEDSRELCDRYLFEQVMDLIDDEEAEIRNLIV